MTCSYTEEHLRFYLLCTRGLPPLRARAEARALRWSGGLEGRQCPWPFLFLFFIFLFYIFIFIILFLYFYITTES